MANTVVDQDVCSGGLNVEDTRTSNNISTIKSETPTCAISVGLGSEPTTSADIGLEVKTYETVQNTDVVRTETEKTEDIEDLKEELIAFDIENVKEVAEPQRLENQAYGIILNKCEVIETKNPQEDTKMGMSYTSPGYKFENACQITGAWEEFRKKGEIYMKGCKWSPDGTCILTNSEDNVLRVFDLPRELHCQETWQRDKSLPELEPALRVREGGVIYDYSWYPLMSSWNPLSCCFVSTSKDSPVHLWDAFNGELRCTYRAYNAVDEVETAHSLAFSPSGEKLYCGFNNCIRVFNTNIPGRECMTRNLKRQFLTQKQTGIISCISVNPALPNVYAAGSYCRSIVERIEQHLSEKRCCWRVDGYLQHHHFSGIYSEPNGTLLCLLLGQTGGVTHIQFSPDGTKLMSGGRKDSEIIFWDIRNPGNILFTVKREVTTNQRVYFDITSDSRYFVSGNTNGTVSVWDITQTSEANVLEPVLSPCSVISAHKDCVNGISIHRQYPILATTSGQRHITNSQSECDSSSESIYQETSLKLWWVGNVTSS